METAVIATLAGIAALLILSALFAGSETAFTAASGPITAIIAPGSAMQASGATPGPLMA